MSTQLITSNFKGKDILSLSQFDRSSIEKVCRVAAKIESSVKKGIYPQYLKGKLLALLFYEPSSRTFSSFATAVKRLGGQTIEYQNPSQTSSAVKGETMEDTARVFENYVDAIIIRHPQKGVPEFISNYVSIPIVNAGDGAGEHPTQAFLDLYTIYKKHKKLDSLKIMMVGDLLYGRTVHSLLKGLSFFRKNTIYLLSPSNLRLPKELIAELKNKLTIVEISSEKQIPSDCDVWYWTRVQKERFKNLKEYEKTKHAFVLSYKLLQEKGNKKLILMHPLPRVGEVETQVDTDSRALYLTEEIKSGVFIRMALLSLIVGKIK